MWNTNYERELRAHRWSRRIGKAVLFAGGVYFFFLFLVNVLTFWGVAGGGSADYVKEVHWPLKLLPLLQGG